MKLRTRTVTIFAATTILLVLILNESFSSIILVSYAKIEANEVVQTVNQIQGAFQGQLSSLNTKVSNWAPWNDTYTFVQNNNTAYIADNLAANSTAPFGVNIMVFLNSTGGIVYDVGYNLTATSLMTVPNDFISLIHGDIVPYLVSNDIFRNISSSVTGVALIKEGPLIFAAQPVLTSEGTGPIEGAVVFAQYVDASFIEGLSQSLHLPLGMALYDSWNSSLNSSYAFTPPSTYVHPLNGMSISGYYVVSDIHRDPVFVLETTMPRTVYEQGVVTLNYLDLSVATACIVFALCMFFLVERTMLSRLHRLATEVVRAGSQSGSSRMVSISGNDEISSLATSINEMIGEIDSKTLQLRKSERFSAIGELATMVAHDLRNPLQAIANAEFFLKQSPNSSDKEKEILNIVDSAVKYSNKIVSDLLDYSKEVRLEPGFTNPRSLVSQSLSMVQVPSSVKVIDESPDKPKLRLDVDKIRRVFTNLVSNAVDAMPQGGSLLIKTSELDHKVAFEFTDTGTGMTKEVLGKAFTPLFTTKAKGMGFGLSICKRIVEAHGGSISVESSQGKGTTFRVSLPLDFEDSKGGEENS
ncbi:MAG TPA: CHASE4 domain-containing protein [Nitrososphaerales archaeon]|nr:CHASE4 domain-containing protein [Nitrososphaerales archaeon]